MLSETKRNRPRPLRRIRRPDILSSPFWAGWDGWGWPAWPDCAHGRALFSWYVLLLMALYVPAGWVVSRLRAGPRPDRKTGCKAVLYPALCAWAGPSGRGLLLLFSGREALFPLAFTGFALLALSFLLASPSALFMLLTLDLLSGSLRDAGVNAFFQSSAWFAAMFLARPAAAHALLFGLAPAEKAVDNGEKCDKIIQLSQETR